MFYVPFTSLFLEIVIMDTSHPEMVIDKCKEKKEKEQRKEWQNEEEQEQEQPKALV